MQGEVKGIEVQGCAQKIERIRGAGCEGLQKLSIIFFEWIGKPQYGHVSPVNLCKIGDQNSEALNTTDL